MTKVCTKCGEAKPLEAFYWRKDTQAYRNDCKICRKAASKCYASTDRGKAVQKKRNKKRYQLPEYLELKKHHCAKRRAQKIKALPMWADEKKIRQIYADCPDGFAVDHYYPLTSDKVCGLHTAENLMYVTPEYNSYKSNKMPEEVLTEAEYYEQKRPTS